MSKRKVPSRRPASRRIYYHLALRGSEIRTVRGSAPSIYPAVDTKSEPTRIIH